MNQTVNRCAWAGSEPLNIEYHDLQWGVPLHDDRTLFEMVTLEGAQAGLSWITILKKRENYKKAFDNFEVKKVAEYDEKKIASLLLDSGIIRNKLKINSTIQNAKAFIKIQKEFGNFDKYIWKFVNHKPINNALKQAGAYPTTSEEAHMMSNDLLKRGFKFVGPTICYAFMEAIGMINDHQTHCFRYKEVSKLQ